MQALIQIFQQIDGEADLRSFLQQYHFRLADSRSHQDQYVLGAFIGKCDGKHAKLTHRLLDAIPAGMPTQDRNRLLLEIEGMEPIEASFKGNY